MSINLSFMKPGLCPLCGVMIGASPLMVGIKLNNGSLMPTPACLTDLGELQKPEVQDEFIKACIEVWIKEIESSENIKPEDKPREIERVKKLEVIHEQSN